MRVVAFIFSLITAGLLSLPMGNPGSTQIIERGLTNDGSYWLGAKLGYTHDATIDRSVEAVAHYRGGMIEEFSSNGDMGMITLTCIDRIAIYGELGAENYKLINSPIPTQEDVYRTANHFCWTAGSRILLFNFSKTKFGFDVKYHGSKPQISSITSNGTAVRPLSISRINYRQWQVEFGATYQMDIFYPYLGVCFSSIHADLKNLPPGYLPSINSIKIRSHKKFGLSIGATISTGDYFMLSVEGRVIDEQEVNIVWAFRF